MKMCKKLLIWILAVVLTLGMTVSTALADEGDLETSYTYKVTFSAGNQGVFEKGEDVLSIRTSDPENIKVVWMEKKIVVSGLHLGDEVGIDPQKAVKLDASSKYYVKGIRQSGRDNSTVSATVFEVVGDADYVVAYGIKGNQVSYTVKYQDESGRQLASDTVYYGNIGDKPVVAYKYISGYAPKSLGLTKTLSENAAENVFTFVYTSVPTVTVNEVVNEVIVEVVVSGGARPAPSGGSTGTGTGSKEETEPVEETQENGEEPTQDVEEQPTQGDPENESEDGSGDIIVDLDEPEVPLAPGVEVDNNLLVYGAIGAAALAALIAAAYLMFMAKAAKKKEK